jgi:hypothetical protein
MWIFDYWYGKKTNDSLLLVQEKKLKETHHNDYYFHYDKLSDRLIDQKKKLKQINKRHFYHKFQNNKPKKRVKKRILVRRKEWQI